MARSATASSGELWVWDDHDNPGAGTKGVTKASGGIGLNANWETLDVAVFTEHDNTGAHRTNVIKGSNLIQTGANSCVDGSTLEFSSNQIRVKDLGITGAKIATGTITYDKLANDAVTADKLRDDASVDANRAVTTNHIRDSAITTAKIADDNVTPAKMPHDNNRTKNYFTFSFDATTAGTYAKVNGVSTTSLTGIAMRRAGSVTGVTFVNSSGTVGTGTHLYGTYTFILGDKLTFNIVSDVSPYSFRLLKNGSTFITYYDQVTNPYFIVLEVELDD